MTKYEKYIMQFAVTKNIASGIKLEGWQFFSYGIKLGSWQKIINGIKIGGWLKECYISHGIRINDKNLMENSIKITVFFLLKPPLSPWRCWPFYIVW